eukprot:TRINITY_DN264_c0_g1_i1.p1 TRINITY_DN264_c0_g1~~TRINITY_DN264_c0_g1_i1.p1  ORF type:complete len:396 (+),score=102.01 TRINITY_DN264_c0_g1_i1:773-1960(+)
MNYIRKLLITRKKESEEERKREIDEQAEKIQFKIDQTRDKINDIQYENDSVVKELDNFQQYAKDNAQFCGSKLEELPNSREYYFNQSEMLKQLKKESEERLIQKQEEVTQLLKEKELCEIKENYQREIQEKKKISEDLQVGLSGEKEKLKNAYRLLSRVVLMLKRLAPLLLTGKSLEYTNLKCIVKCLTLCGLSLEQKATILSFRNRSFPIESINEDTTVTGKPGYLGTNEKKDSTEFSKKVDTSHDKTLEEKEFQNEEVFWKQRREAIRKKEINSEEKLKEKNKTMDEKEKSETNKDSSTKYDIKFSEGVDKEVLESIQKSSKKRTKEFLMMQRKYSGSNIGKDKKKKEGPPYIHRKEQKSHSQFHTNDLIQNCLLYTSPSPRDLSTSRMPSSA